MCGIYWYSRGISRTDRFTPSKHRCLKPRGPDETKIINSEDFYAAFYRLAIVGVDKGMQPFMNLSDILMCNGEIYNHEEIEADCKVPNTTGSDCECIYQMWCSGMPMERIVRKLHGEFAFTLHDTHRDITYFARDRLGRKPLYYSTNSGGDFDICSLYAGLEFDKKEQVVPGVLYAYNRLSKCLSQVPYHTFSYNPEEEIDDTDSDTSSMQVMNLFVNAVRRRVQQSERPVGFLLSGGFDSSLVLSTALQHCDFKTPPEVFTIGFDENAPDVVSAGVMVEHLKKKFGPNCINWHRVILPLSDAIKAIPSVIKALETYDTTTIRASVPMWLISRYIAQHTKVRVLISGEGSDELFGGYLYFKYAPDDFAFTAEICKLLRELYLFDVLRADRTTAAWGLEVRTPFLDDDFVDFVLSSYNLVRSQNTTKEFIRNVVSTTDLLPDSILWGKKEAFSDAVGLSWKDQITHTADDFVNEHDHSEQRINVSNVIPPQTNEMIYFQYLFGIEFPNSWHLLPKLWLPNQSWIKTGVEPSARVLPIY